MRGTLPWLALLAATWAVTLLVDPWADDSTTDFYLYQPWAHAMLDGLIPYRDYEFEYPPLAAPLIAVAGIAGTGHDEYRLAFALLMFVFIAVVLVACGRLAELTGGDRRLAMAAVAVSPLLTGAMVRTHFDIAAVAIAVVALVALASRRSTLGFVLLGVGAMTKLFPLLMAPVAFAWLWGRRERREAWRGALALGVTLVVLALAWLALSPSGAVDSVQYQAERPLQVESNAVFALLAYNAAGGTAPVFVDSHRAQAAEHDLAGPVGVLSTVLGIAAIALLSLMAARRRETLPLVLAALGAVVAALAFGKVLSPQFLVWLVPVLAVAAAHRMWALAVSSAGAIALTLVEFPARYDDYLEKDPLAVVVVGLRNLLLLVTLALIVRALAGRRAPRALASR